MKRSAARGALAATIALAGVAHDAGAACTTVDGAPAATSESIVLGIRREVRAGNEAGVRKFLETGQALMLRGGNAVEVLERRAENGTVLFRRGAQQLSLWTLEAGIDCTETP
jgi:hypothetical protein